MLTASNLTRIAGGRRLVDDVSARFEPGVLTLIIGPNGAGKSTLLKMLSGQLRPDAGTVSYDGEDIRGRSAASLARTRAVLSQNVSIAFPLRVWEVVMMGRYPHFVGRPTALDERICDEVMELFHVTAFRERDYLTLSGGERQRVHFARVLAQLWRPVPGHTRLLFLDEPLASLDIQHQFEFMRQIQTLSRAKDLVTVGVVHDLNLAAKFADALLLLCNGKVFASGSKDVVLTPAHIKETFGIEPRVLRLDDASTWLVFP
ncbi:heme ABC transporter ATP-binding protein [Pyxidicoccus parkwayensis]|uniref:Heme ABC transporter ATP-binding protein n=1 Tax=Pyxidicoccus parkwayensis TaxID=2813578 RepID=A0ABX7P8E5_9BACT|nr:heme ABC transporter ATP-binding protein [Pyxidicoccus parkwaysis]QSQ26714.1 heme ABC transporter ATP-binding protein [Pyxidicoccus parkwaysis]